MTKDEKKILENVFQMMPKRFTSHDFLFMARKNGITSRDTIRKEIYIFLQLKAENDGRYSKTWVKKTENEDLFNLNKKYSFKDINEIVSFMKSKGYKILRPKTEWEEI